MMGKVAAVILTIMATCAGPVSAGTAGSAAIVGTKAMIASSASTPIAENASFGRTSGLGMPNATAVTGNAGASLPPLLPGDEIYDIHSPVAVPFPWGTIAAQIFVVIIVCWLFVKLRSWLLHMRTDAETVVVTPPPPPPDPLKEALAALSRLRASPIWAEGRIKDICEHLALILKVFLRDRFRLGIGAAATTAELSLDLRRKRVEEGLRGRIEALFELCDTVKFARGDLGGSTLDELFTKTRELLLWEDWRRRRV
ncbi:MAG: hypothetical protein HQM09_09740 [Candidatus Riflebacteria bacterium]|nr:hypothetical protein [Candidatus Riflebacteria bacterium]